MLTIDLINGIDPVRFFDSVHPFIHYPWQEKVLGYEGNQLMMNCHRQAGKSEVAATKGFHKAKYYDDSLILLLSPSLRQSSELFRKVLDITKHDQTMPKKLEDSRLFMTLENDSRIVSLPGKEATVRGFSDVDLIIIDEDSQVLDDLYYSVRPMLAVSGGSIILMSTPRGKRGHFFLEWTEGLGWERVEVQATKSINPIKSLCPRISDDFLKSEIKSIGDRWFRQEYMCEFMEMEDQVFPYELIQSAMTDDVDPFFGSALDDTEPFDFERR